VPDPVTLACSVRSVTTHIHSRSNSNINPYLANVENKVSS